MLENGWIIIGKDGMLIKENIIDYTIHPEKRETMKILLDIIKKKEYKVGGIHYIYTLGKYEFKYFISDKDKLLERDLDKMAIYEIKQQIGII